MGKTLRLMTAVYLERDGKILLLYRIGSRVIKPCWAGIGGHFEPEELRDPQACLLRELGEETGLVADDLEDLRLRYVAVSRFGEEIRENFYFFARLRESVTREIRCNEGVLEWVPRGELLAREMPFSAKPVLRHYLAGGEGTDAVYVGALASEEEGREMTFTELTIR